MKCKKMYTSFFLLFLLLVIDVKAFTQNALEKKVTFELRNTDLKRVLKIIEDQTQIKFAYSSENIWKNKLSITVQNEQVPEVLNKILDDQVTYEAVGDMVILRTTYEIYDPIIVSGKVIDENGNPLPGVTVISPQASWRWLV